MNEAAPEGQRARARPASPALGRPNCLLSPLATKPLRLDVWQPLGGAGEIIYESVKQGLIGNTSHSDC